MHIPVAEAAQMRGLRAFEPGTTGQMSIVTATKWRDFASAGSGVSVSKPARPHHFT